MTIRRLQTHPGQAESLAPLKLTHYRRLKSPAGDVLGALQVLNKPGGFEESDVKLLALAASFSVSALVAQKLRQEAEAARLFEQAQRSSRRCDILFFLGMLVAWFITMLDPWVGIAIGVLVAVVSVTLLLVASTQTSSDQRDSSATKFDDEER